MALTEILSAPARFSRWCTLDFPVYNVDCRVVNRQFFCKVSDYYRQFYEDVSFDNARRHFEGEFRITENGFFLRGHAAGLAVRSVVLDMGQVYASPSVIRIDKAIRNQESASYTHLSLSLPQEGRFYLGVHQGKIFLLNFADSRALRELAKPVF